MKYFYTLMIIICYHSIAFGQTKELRNSFTYKCLGIDTYSPYLEELFRFDQQTFGFSATYNRYLTKNLSLSLPFRFGQMNYPYAARYFHNDWDFYAQDVAIHYNFFISEKKKIQPYITAGIGLMYIKQAEEVWETQFPIELGINYRIIEGIFLQLSTAYRISTGAESWHNGIGIHFLFDSKKDKLSKISSRSTSTDDLSKYLRDDRDYSEILDDHHSSAVEIVDTDKDGIPNALDQCPKIYGDEDAFGCPVEDIDNDGLANHEDRCPEQAGMLEFAGCPDTDGDRIPDIYDHCPNEAGVKSCKGCPDTDGDKVPNKIDKCPTEKGRADNEGCPMMEFSEIALKGILKPVLFDRNSHCLDSNDFSNLDYIIQVMTKYPSSVLSISGIAFDSDNKLFNNHLSIERAKSCYDYLIKNGIPAARVTYQGLGNSREVNGFNLQKSVDFQLFIQ